MITMIKDNSQGNLDGNKQQVILCGIVGRNPAKNTNVVSIKF